jgi:hypothetical protein
MKAQGPAGRQLTSCSLTDCNLPDNIRHFRVTRCKAAERATDSIVPSTSQPVTKVVRSKSLSKTVSGNNA